VNDEKLGGVNGRGKKRDEESEETQKYD